MAPPFPALLGEPLPSLDSMTLEVFSNFNFSNFNHPVVPVPSFCVFFPLPTVLSLRNVPAPSSSAENKLGLAAASQLIMLLMMELLILINPCITDQEVLS